jgi:hypothetical protein
MRCLSVRDVCHKRPKECDADPTDLNTQEVTIPHGRIERRETHRSFAPILSSNRVGPLRAVAVAVLAQIHRHHGMALAREVLGLRRHVAMVAASAMDQQHRRRAACSLLDVQRDAVAVQKGHGVFSGCPAPVQERTANQAAAVPLNS